MLRPFALVCLALVALAGCRNRGAPADDDGPSTPRPVARPVADPKAEMLGAWTVDVERLPEQPEFARMPEQQRALALEMAGNLLASMTVRFDAHSYSITTGGKTIEGTWRVVAQRGGTLELELSEQAGEGEPPRIEKMRLQVDSRGLVMVAAEGEALPLRRKVDDPARQPAKVAAP